MSLIASGIGLGVTGVTGFFGAKKAKVEAKAAEKISARDAVLHAKYSAESLKYIAPGLAVGIGAAVLLWIILKD
jgi:hypothetical protein